MIHVEWPSSPRAFRNASPSSFLCPRDDSQGALGFAPLCPSVCPSVRHALRYRVCVINSSHSFIPRHTKYVEGYIVFVFPSVRPSFRDSVRLSVRPSIQALTFYVKVLREVFALYYIFESLPFRLLTYD